MWWKSLISGVVAIFLTFAGMTATQAAEPVKNYTVDYHNGVVKYSYFKVEYDSPSQGHKYYNSGILAMAMDRQTTVPSDAYNIVIRYDEGDIFGGAFNVKKWYYREMTSDLCVSSWGTLFYSGADIKKGRC